MQWYAIRATRALTPSAPFRRNGALEIFAYSYAPRQIVGLDMGRWESDLARKDGPKKARTVIKSAWLER